MKYRNDNNNNASSGGIGFVGLLTVAFIVLKLCGVISWSWWWVLSPIWISAIITIIILIGVIIWVAKN
jgi:Flp pilus assembly protein TadB